VYDHVEGGLAKKAAVGEEVMAEVVDEAVDKPDRVCSHGSLQGKLVGVPKALKFGSRPCERSRSYRAGVAGLDQACPLACR